MWSWVGGGVIGLPVGARLFFIKGFGGMVVKPWGAAVGAWLLGRACLALAPPFASFLSLISFLAWQD
jgi:hypothetical protein